MPDEPLNPGVTTSVPCPSCGVDVSVGYPRCPRCHAAVPQAPRAKRQTFREANIAGGTSVEPVTGPGGGNGLLLVGLAAAVALLLVIWLATRGDDTKKAAEPAAGVVEDEGDEDEGGGQDDEDDDTTPDEARPDRPAADDLPAAIRDLDEALRAAQMWSKVTRAGDVVVVESSLCEDSAMWSAIAPLASQLRDAGATAVRCQAQHGGVVFERDL